MPRTKNRGVQQSFSPSYTIRRWRLGEYIRLSKEDLKKGKDDSNSVKNQRDLCNERENQLCCGKRPFPFCPELQRCGKSD